MPKRYSSSHSIKVLVRKGFNFISQRGSHTKYRKQSGKFTYTAIVPVSRKEIPYGTFRSILRQSHLQEKDFER